MENNSDQKNVLKNLYEMVPDIDNKTTFDSSTWIDCEEQCDLSSEY
jgi:hypothetical protein